ncbi:MAG TPA: hypothetical protein H9794_05745 [Candidatus Mediterraneibacter merdigallinarum]|nr:hypothetical protein [Candidatus Mediterraneibacter merdigallinarum]
MERLKEFLDWHCENPHNVNFKMIVAKEDREETLNGMHEMSKLLDTGLTPEQIVGLKERDTEYFAKTSIFDHESVVCKCGNDIEKDSGFGFCPYCGQRLKWED